ncbi:hypothetical protein [Acholeplasma granularum]|uniref:hypothetical protein n=1 Tax=Acholeplasma granularum TaxID=264635 RepID=UPI00046EE50B|nr:hypothetical protein [Acholeplasma granularum]
MKKLDKAIILLLSIAILTIVIITFIIPDLISSPIKITLSLIFYVFIIIVIVYSYKLNKKDNDNFLEISNLIKNNEFFKAEEYIKANLIKSKHLVSDIKYKFLLVTLELTKGNHDEYYHKSFRGIYDMIDVCCSKEIAIIHKMEEFYEN